MKKLLMAFMLCVSFLFANNTIKLFPNSWQMVGVGFDYNLSKDLPYSSDDFKIIWFYQDGQWKAFSKDSSIISLISQKGLWGDFISKNGAFWILPKKELLFYNFRDKLDTIKVKPGWNMIGVTNWASDIYQMEKSGLKSFFVYRDGKWKYLYRTNQGGYQGDLVSISFSEGAWAYNDTNETKYFKTWTIKHYWDRLLANKKFTFNDGKYFILDQNGTVLSNDTNLSNKQWYGYRLRDDYVNFDIDDNNTLISYHIYKNNNSWAVQIKSVNTLNFLPSHILDIIEQDKYKNLSIPVTITDYQKDPNISQTVKEVMDDIKDLLTNGDVNAETVLNSAQIALQNVDDNDAKVTLAFISLIKAMDDPIVGNSININSSALNVGSFFSALKSYGGDIPDQAIKLAQNITNYNQNAKGMLRVLASSLKTSADGLEDVTKDKNYIFNYAPLTGESKMNYVDIKALQSMMYLLASKFELLSAYQLGDNEWLQPKTETIYNAENSYIKASIDPAGFFNSGTFFVNPEQDELNEAKRTLLKALKSYNTILLNHWYGKGLLLSGSNLTGNKESEVIRDINLAIKNLEGKIPSVCLVEDDLNFNLDTNSYDTKIKKEYINLASLFDENTAVQATDFPQLNYNGTWNKNNSKIYDAPVDANGNELDINFPDNLKSYMTHLFLGSKEYLHNTPGEYVFSALGYDWHRRYTEPKYYGNVVKKLDNGNVEFIAYYKAPSLGTNGKSRAQAKIKLSNNPADEISITFTPKEFLNAPHSRPEIRFVGFNWIDDKNGGLFARIKLLGNHSNKFCYQINAYINDTDSATQYCIDMNKQIEENHQYTLLIKALDNSKYIFNMYEGSTMDDNLLMVSKSISLSELNENTKNSYKLLYPEDGNSFKTKKFRSIEVKVINSDANSSSSNFKTVVDINGVTINRY